MSTWAEVVSKLKEINAPAVLVTGPQRSGTTIAAHVIAQELGFRYVDEDEFGIHDGPRATEIMRQGKVVLQAPALCHVAHEAADIGVPVVMVRRRLDEIEKSEHRVHWRTMYDGLNLKAEQWKYWKCYGIPFADSKRIALIKYEVWDKIQKAQCVSFDLDYASLVDHPLFKEESERKDFAPRQWQKDVIRNP